ncbi:hypothetical protein O181_025232 [Austropuccinia psidii MF-1]|uniref:Thioesterase domain-containing protein n=1 Tax=Austropuccinia psidii MF-1 TaxID=1389203 RepID=A0A9Q3GZP0_9BASI|nr:hypothetical protein [Austropuccinia psidii MF-1]
MSASNKFVKQVWKDFMKNQGHDFHCLKNLKIVSTTSKFKNNHEKDLRIKFKFKIGNENLNRLKTLHGGLISSLVDSCGSLSLSLTGLWFTGVSTDLNVSFLQSAGTMGDEIDIEAQVDSIGRTLAYTSVIVKNPATSEILARGSHTKFIAKTINHERNVKFDESGDRVIEENACFQ